MQIKYFAHPCYSAVSFPCNCGTDFVGIQIHCSELVYVKIFSAFANPLLFVNNRSFGIYLYKNANNDE